MGQAIQHMEFPNPEQAVPLAFSVGYGDVYIPSKTEGSGIDAQQALSVVIAVLLIVLIGVLMSLLKWVKQNKTEAPHGAAAVGAGIAGAVENCIIDSGAARKVDVLVNEAYYKHLLSVLDAALYEMGYRFSKRPLPGSFWEQKYANLPDDVRQEVLERFARQKHAFFDPSKADRYLDRSRFKGLAKQEEAHLDLIISALESEGFVLRQLSDLD